MNPVRKRAALVGVVVAALVFFVLVARRHEVVRFALERAISLGTGYSVTIGEQRFGFTHGALLHVHVSKDGEPVLDARRIDLWYSPRDLLPGSRHRYGISQVAVDHPYVTIVRHKDGSYNIQVPQVSAPPPTVPSPVNRVPYALTVRVRDAAGELRAPFALDPSARKLGIRNVALDAAINTNARTHYTLAGEFSTNPVAQPFSAVGTVDVTRGYAMHHAWAAAVPLRAIGNFFINSNAARILGGTAHGFDARAYALDVQPFVSPQYHTSARLSVSDGQMQIVGLARPLEHIAGTLQLVDSTFFARELGATLADVPVRVAGAIYDFSSPNYRLGLSGTGDVQNLRHALGFSQTQPVRGITQIAALIEGPLASPTIVVHGDAPHAEYAGIPLDDVHADIALSNGVVYVNPLLAHASGAALETRGTMTLGDTLHSQLVAHVEGPASAFPYAGEVLGREPIVGDASLDGTGGTFHVRGAVASARGTDRMAANLTLEPTGVIDVEPFWIHAGHGDVEGAYHLDRKTDQSAFWIAASGVDVRAPRAKSFGAVALPQVPPIDARVDEFLASGGGTAGTNALVAGRLAAHDAVVAGVRIDNVSGHFAGRLSGAAIDDVRAHGPWGTIAGAGSFSTNALLVRGQYDGTLQGLQPFLAGAPAHGAISGPAALAITPNGVTVQGDRLAMRDASVRGIPVSRASGTLVVRNGVLDVYSADAGVSGGDLVAAGNYKKTISLVGAGIGGAGLHGLGLPLDGGAVAADGTLREGAPLPDFDGTVSVAHGRVQHYAIAGTGVVHLANARAHLDHVVGGVNGAYAIARGDVSALTSGDPAYDVQAYVPAGDVTTALRTLQVPTLASDGTFNGNFHVTGRGLYPTVNGPVNVPAGSVNGLPFIDGSALLSADRGGVIARHGAVLVGTTHLQFGAGIRPHASGVGVRAARADFSDFNNFFDTGDTLDGTGSLRFDLISQQHRISSNGALDIEKLRYRNLPIGDTDASWSSAHNVLNGSLVVGGAQGVLRAKGSIGFAPSPTWQDVVKRSRYNVALTLQNLDLSLWLSTLGFPQVPVTGRVDGTATVAGTYPALQMNGIAGLSGGTLGRLPLDSLSAAFRARAGRFYLEKAMLEAPGITADGRGSIGFAPNAPLSLDVHAQSDDPARLATELSSQQLPITGFVETSAHMGGTLEKPTFEGGFDAQNLDAYGVHVTSIFGSVRLHGRALELRDAGAVFARGQVTLAGTLPLELQPFGVGPANARVSLDLSAANLDPAIFERLFGHDTKLGGTVDGQLQVAGNVGNPRIYGHFGLRDGSYVSDLERVPITQTVASLTFDREHADVDRLSARVGNGTVDGSGRIAFAQGFSSAGGQGASFEVRAKANGAQLDLPAYGRGTVDGAIVLSRALGHDARLSGDALLSNATIPFSAFLAGLGSSQNGASAGGPPLALDFDVNLAAGRNVRVRGSGYGAGLDIGAQGATHLGGSLVAPTMDGSFTSTGGTLTYFDRAFRVQSATVAFTPSAGIVPTLHAVGTTHVVNPDPDPARNPYGSADITIKVDGPVDGLRVAFDSNPPGYSQEQILALIAPFGGFVGGIAYSPVNGVQQPGDTTPLGALQPVPGRPGMQSAGTITVGQEAFNILNAQFTAGLLAPFETALSSGLGLSDLNLTVDYYGNVGISARRLLGKEISIVYATTFGIPQRNSVGFEVNPNGTTSATLSLFWQTGPTRLFQSPTAAISSNPRLSVGQSIQARSGFSFLLTRSFW